MTIKNLAKSAAIACATLFATAGISGVSHASTSYVDGASIPYALAYGTCVYANSGQTDCAAKRDALLAEADPVLNRFYAGSRLEARRSLRFLFDDMERQALKFQENDNILAPETLSFMGCVADSIRGQQDFQRGVFVGGTDAFRACEDIYNAYIARDRSDKTVQRNVNFMRYIKSILPNTATGNQQIHAKGLLTERGPRG